MREPDVLLNKLGTSILDAAYKVHTELGPGLLESAYRACLAHEQRLRGFGVLTEVKLPLVYEGIELDQGYRIDILVEGTVVIEVKAVTEMHPVFDAQVLTYLKLSGCKLGYLLNFHVPLLKHGIKRFVLTK
jgi:GxxExxY protein